MNLQETIKRILREESQIPSVIKRRVTNSDIEEAFLKALDLIDGERLNNQFSPVKNISLKTFAKLVIDEMVTSLEQDYFSDGNRIYFDNDETYHTEIRVPLMNYFGDKIKRRYNSEEEELIEYARTLKNARRQGAGLRFPKSAIKANPLRFRPYNREGINESDPKTGTGKKPKGSDRRLYTDENPSDTVSVKFKTKEDIVDTLNKESFKSKPHKRQSQIINLIHQRVRAAYQNASDPETKKRLKRGLDYIENEKEKSKEKTIKLQKEEQTESVELTERCWKGYTQKGMKTMFGKRYPNCVKKTKK